MFFPLLLRVLYTRRSIVQFCIQLIDNSLCILYHGIKKKQIIISIFSIPCRIRTPATQKGGL